MGNLDLMYGNSYSKEKSKIEKIWEKYKLRNDDEALSKQIENFNLRLFRDRESLHTEHIPEEGKTIYNSPSFIEKQNILKKFIVRNFNNLKANYKKNTIKNFIEKDIPDFKNYNPVELRPIGYEFDKEFWNASNKQIIDLLAKYNASKDFSDDLHKLQKEIKEKQEIKIENSFHNLKWVGTKIDLIKILVSLNDLEMFKNVNEKTTEKKEVINYFEKILNIDLKNHEIELSKGIKHDNKVVLKIFKDMSNKITERREINDEIPRP